ncbi:CotH kinase family protein [uncultured Ruminococcus sp.]|uniref:CotH kinase family protein n=1 Tax=uncultured Ruminococcus sp. TaxID=165186 RepID=UPI0025FBAFE7|nr:CotH kinase family protein [uncultured Ruminococcus sp.]
MRKKVIAFTAALIICFVNGGGSLSGTRKYGSPSVTAAAEDNSAISGDYANASLFDDTRVHTINIIITDEEWEKINEATSEDKEYAKCNVEIDGELFKNVALKAKGHSSLSFARGRTDSTNERVGLRINFSKYDDNTTYHGLNKLSLNNFAADITCMKDYISYHLMDDMGVHSPLSSYTVVKKNGEDFALFLAVEDVDKSFAVRNYGNAEVDLYKPESESAAKQSDLEAVLQIFSGNKYADLDKTDRVEPWNEISAKMHPEALKDAACCRWINDDPASYQNIWDSDELKCTDEDKKVMIDCLDKLNNGTEEEALSVLDTDQLMRYWAVHGFMNNYDSLVGKARAWNFYLCENNGVLSYIPWDYNESFGGMDARVVIRDVLGDIPLDTTPTGLDNVMSAEKDLINMPIDNPNRIGGTELLPMLHKWISSEEYLDKYHEICRELTGLEEKYKKLTSQTESIIKPYVNKELTFYTGEQFDDAMKNMELYMKYRFESYRNQVSGRTPSTWEGQKEKPDTLIEPEGLELYKMASAKRIINIPPAQVIAPLVNAYLGKDSDRSAEHFAKLLLNYFKNPVSMFDKVPILIQYPTCRKDAVKIMHRKYGTASMFTVQGGPPEGVQGGPPEGVQGGPPSASNPETAADAQQAITANAE